MSANAPELYTGPFVCWPAADGDEEAAGCRTLGQKTLAEMDRDEEQLEAWEGKR